MKVSDPRFVPPADPAAATALERTWRDPPGLYGWFAAITSSHIPMAKKI